MSRIFWSFLACFWLGFGGCGAAIFAVGYLELGIGFLGVAFIFGLTYALVADVLNKLFFSKH